MSQKIAAGSLATRTAIGASWVIAWRMATRGLGIVSMIVLVRLLPPADFGLVALATSFSQAVEGLSGIGVTEALVRESRTSEALYNTGFTLNLMRGTLMAAIIAAEAWPVATFFGDQRLTYVLLALAATAFAGSLENIGVVDFRRSLAFEKEFQLAVMPRIVGIVVSISFAVLHPSLWALVAGLCANRLLRVVLTYWMHPFRPRITLVAWETIFRFSLWTWLSGLVTLVRDRADTVVIGRMFGPGPVGIYSVGYEFGSLTSTELVEPLTAALFAGFSEAGRSGSNIAENFFKAISLTFLATLPMGVGLAFLAQPAIQLGFGPRWLAAVPLVQIFAIICTLKVIAYFSSVLLNAQGLVHVSFRIVVASTVARVVLLALLVQPFGLMGAAMAAAGCIVVEETLCLAVMFRRLHLRIFNLVRDNWRCVIATLAMAGVLWWEGCGTAQPDAGVTALLRDMALGIGSGAATYVVIILLLWWAAGRPRGAETAFLQIAAGFFHYSRRFRARPGVE